MINPSKPSTCTRSNLDQLPLEVKKIIFAYVEDEKKDYFSNRQSMHYFLETNETIDPIFLSMLIESANKAPFNKKIKDSKVFHHDLEYKFYINSDSYLERLKYYYFILANYHVTFDGALKNLGKNSTKITAKDLKEYSSSLVRNIFELFFLGFMINPELTRTLIFTFFNFSLQQLSKPFPVDCEKSTMQIRRKQTILASIYTYLAQIKQTGSIAGLINQENRNLLTIPTVSYKFDDSLKLFLFSSPDNKETDEEQLLRTTRIPEEINTRMILKPA